MACDALRSGMPEAPASAAKRPRLDGDKPAYVYVKVKGAASVDEIRFEDLPEPKSVAGLLGFTKNCNKRKLNHLDASDLRAYRAEDGEVQLNSGTRIASILDGNSDTNPFL